MLFIGCNDSDPKLPDSGLNSDLISENPEKKYSLDEYGNITSTEISIEDFSFYYFPHHTNMFLQ